MYVFHYFIRAKINLSNHMSTEDFVEHWKETECYRALLAENYFKQVFAINIYVYIYSFTLNFHLNIFQLN